ncbi:MAG: DUF401 family protein [Dehalococcoidia bacterium]|nr:DUF401 family protein [Dehalococcoidia bacterium]
MVEVAKLLSVFVLMMVLIHRKANLGQVMMIAAATLGLLFGMNALSIGRTFLTGTLDDDTLSLIVILVLIMFLENLMRKTLILQRMVNALKILIKDHRLVMALLPAFIGFLPSPGGAMFSAPMVGEVSREMPMSPETKSFINYWYRHIWEYVFPLYPGIILASKILEVPIRNLMVLQFPFTIVAILAGIPIAFWGTKNHSLPVADRNIRKALLDLLIGIGPITIVIILVLVFKVDLVWALALAVVGLLIANRYDFNRILSLRESFSINTVFLVLGVMIFKQMLVESRAVDALPAFAASQGIPVFVVVFALPFLVGLLTGYAQAVVGIAFPVFLGLSGSGGLDMNLVAFGFVSGFAGVLLSPTHLCLILTIQHFKADFGRVQRKLLVPVVILVAYAAIFYLPR